MKSVNKFETLKLTTISATSSDWLTDFIFFIKHQGVKIRHLYSNLGHTNIYMCNFIFTNVRAPYRSESLDMWNRYESFSPLTAPIS